MSATPTITQPARPRHRVPTPGVPHADEATRPAPAPVAPEPAPADEVLPHDCACPDVDATVDRGRRGRREIGIDVARGIALIGMMVVHILPAVTDEGDITTPWLLSVGKSAALFAVVAGVGIAFSTGGTRRPTGRRYGAAVAGLLVRALLIGAIGLALCSVVSAKDAFVILPYYALLFVLAIPFLRLRVRWLVVLAAVVGLGMPVLSFVLRADLPWVQPVNLTFGDVVAAPTASLTELLLTGAYPVLPWLTYVLVGLAVGRTRLSLRGVAAGIATIGVALALTARFVSWYLLDVLGGRSELASDAVHTMSLQAYSEVMIWGSSGTLPADSPWWLAVLAPHTATAPDLFFTIGIALAVLGVAILLGRVVAPLLWPLAAAGSMPLTLYVAHLLMLASPVRPEDPTVEFWAQVAILLAVAMLWRHWFPRGPLEQLVYRVTDRVQRLVLGRRRATDAAGTRPPASVPATT